MNSLQAAASRGLNSVPRLGASGRAL